VKSPLLRIHLQIPYKDNRDVSLRIIVFTRIHGTITNLSLGSASSVALSMFR
jgi:hypothetical protein